ncbi:RusA family crossover junction endodeoxyribonuclease [Longispora albida]|uniref:RusA family crossover junction endodeoxyribonuclease n=1 Tax=Longispora albida TaxID=203523 RepID=UPI000367A8F2|nr:RusA family crossover junction endodeoxyribonuclease [Longispora albida]
MSELLLAVYAYGNPAPQGSLRHVGGGRLIDSSPRLRPWRATVTAAARAALAVTGQTTPHLGPVQVMAVATMPKPKSAPKKTRTWPSKRPDVDKLGRALLDALTDAKVWADDSQVVELTATKCWPDEHPLALPIPGVYIQIWTVTE